MKNNIMEFFRKLLMLVAIIAILYSGYQLYLIKVEKDLLKQVDNEIVDIIGKEEEDDSVKFLTKKSFNDLYEKNNDFIGYFYYPSLDINEVVTQTSNNSYYLTKTFFHEYHVYGTVFKAYDQSKEDQNWTLYGHWIQNSTDKFSNLHKLREEENYADNKTFYYADDEFVYEYEVAYVIYHNALSETDNVSYWQGSFSENQFNEFVANADVQQIYDTGVELSYEDKLMSLQTCITYNSDERLVVIGKEVSRVPISDQ